MKYRPVFIIGAPRSGTNMLRDALCEINGIATWPCDEINPVWKHGQLRYPYDDLTVERARPEVKRFIQRKFDRIAPSNSALAVVEKTCANSLRVAYLARVVPDARFVFIYRNGMDAVASAVKRWRAPMDLGYTMRKLRFVPASDIPVYGMRFVKNRLLQFKDSERRLRAWGPMTEEIAIAAADGDIEQAAAIQWRQCVEYALDQFPSGEPAASVCYEQFVKEPESEMRRLVDALGFDVTPNEIADAVAGVKPNKSGRGSDWLTNTGRAAELEAALQPAMRRLGYDTRKKETG